MQLMDERPYTLTVPDAGRIYFGLGRNAAYAAAARGDIPTIRIGRLLKVPIAAIRDASDPMVGAAQDSDGNVLDPAVYTRKVNGIRLLLIGRVRGIDIDEHPPPGTIPVSQRPENAGRTWRGRTRHSAVLADEG